MGAESGQPGRGANICQMGRIDKYFKLRPPGSPWGGQARASLTLLHVGYAQGGVQQSPTGGGYGD